jgi:adenine-specific DNA methylase
VDAGETLERRKALGIYYTPPHAATLLASWVIRRPQDLLLEPSFGGCAMLAAAVAVFRDHGNDSPSKQLYGFDVDSRAFEHLERMGLENDAAHFKKGNFLKSAPHELRVDAVLANPPYVSYHRQTLSQRRLTQKLRDRYFPKLPRFASLWAFFLLHSMSFLRPGGRMAFVLPNSIANAHYGQALLHHLSERFSEVTVVQVAERLFIQEGADERIALLFLSGYEPNGRADRAPIRSLDVLRISEIENLAAGALGVEVHGNSEDPRSASVIALNKVKDACLVELGSIAKIQIGEVVGNTRFFVRTLREWKEDGVPSKYLFPVLTRAAQIRGLEISEASNDLSRIPRLLIPPKNRLPKAIAAYLDAYAPDDVEANVTFQKREIWYRCSYDSTAQAFIGSMAHDWPRILGNTAGVSCANSFYKVIVREKNTAASWLPIISLTTPYRLSAEIVGRIRGSGALKLEPSDVAKLCVPKVLPQRPDAYVRRLQRRLEKLVRGGKLEVAARLADNALFVKTAIISAETMSELRAHLLVLLTRRLQKL